MGSPLKKQSKGENKLKNDDPLIDDHPGRWPDVETVLGTGISADLQNQTTVRLPIIVHCSLRHC